MTLYSGILGLLGLVCYLIAHDNLINIFVPHAEVTIKGLIDRFYTFHILVCHTNNA